MGAGVLSCVETVVHSKYGNWRSEIEPDRLAGFKLISLSCSD
jgi:hypothetical protein